jgi:hypothetical protein
MHHESSIDQEYRILSNLATPPHLTPAIILRTLVEESGATTALDITNRERFVADKSGKYSES